jgi:hypothetical protein
MRFTQSLQGMTSVFDFGGDALSCHYDEKDECSIPYVTIPAFRFYTQLRSGWLRKPLMATIIPVTTPIRILHDGQHDAITAAILQHRGAALKRAAHAGSTLAAEQQWEHLTQLWFENIIDDDAYHALLNTLAESQFFAGTERRIAHI